MSMVDNVIFLSFERGSRPRRDESRRDGRRKMAWSDAARASSQHAERKVRDHAPAVAANKDLAILDLGRVADRFGIITREIFAAAEGVSDACYEFCEGGFGHKNKLAGFRGNSSTDS
jgi:hypothetical protein